MTAVAAREAADGRSMGGGARPALAKRYHAFDCVRALAMLLGVFYHWQFVGGGFGMMMSGPKGSVDHWLHSFRMGLFFLISGFFAAMMLGKYGLGKYLARRSWRIGMPLLVAIVGFAGYRYAQDYFPALNPMNAMAAPAFGGFGGFGQGGGNGFGGFGGMPGGAAPTTPVRGGQAFGGAGFGGFGGPAAGGPGGGGAPATPPPAMPAMPPMGMQGPAHPAADWLIKTFAPTVRRSDGREVPVRADYFMLQHLWFLWYLLVFVIVAPLVAKVAGAMLVRDGRGALDGVGAMLIRWNLAPLVLGLAAVPALLHAKGFDWTLMNPGGFSGVFPDVMVQYFPDMPYYFVYFLAGWWLWRLRGELAAIGGPWLWNLALGVVGFAVSQRLASAYLPAMPFGGFGMFGGGGNAPAAPEWARLLSFGCYAAGAAYTSFGLMGLFQKYLDRPTTLGRYFTDTMLWVYLVQIPLMPYLAPWVDYQNTSWWAATLGGMVLVTGVALVLFELVVRPTPLVHVFGPASLGKRGKK